ncbi:MAG: hypothetical protein ABIX28_04245, partial [Vicinamibacterales bacterium]
MKSVVWTMTMLALAAPAVAQQAPMDHSAHMAEMQQPPAAPQAPPGGAQGVGGAPQGGAAGRGGPQIDVPWNDAIPPGT